MEGKVIAWKKDLFSFYEGMLYLGISWYYIFIQHNCDKLMWKKALI